MVRIAVDIMAVFFFLGGLLSLPTVGSAVLFIGFAICCCAHVIMGQLDKIQQLLDPAYRRAQNERRAQQVRDAALMAELRDEAAEKQAAAAGASGEEIRFECSCGQTIRAPRKTAGRTARCRKCGRSVVVPR